MFATQVKDKLEPLFMEVLHDLSEGGDPLAFAFFLDRLKEMRLAEQEEDVLAVFLNLSQAAFLGFQFSEGAWHKVDTLLAEAEAVAFAMTAQGPH